MTRASSAGASLGFARLLDNVGGALQRVVDVRPRPRHDAARARAATTRAALGDAAFTVEWHAGRLLRWDEAAAAALATAPPGLVDLDDAAVDADLERRIAAEVT